MEIDDSHLEERDGILEKLMDKVKEKMTKE